MVAAIKSLSRVGNAELISGAGNDRLSGGVDTDELRGGTGSDRSACDLTNSGGVDYLDDFETGDVLDFHAAAAIGAGTPIIARDWGSTTA